MDSDITIEALLAAGALALAIRGRVTEVPTATRDRVEKITLARLPRRSARHRAA
jgi:hypothetical protein